MLIPPLAELPFNAVQWERDLLPEYLWIAGLFDSCEASKAYELFQRFLDAVDKVWRDGLRPPVGYLSDFGEVLPRHRKRFLSENRELIAEAFIYPIGRILTFYPENPAAWLSQCAPREQKRLDPEAELARLRRLIRELLPGRADRVGHFRALSLSRLLKHGKVLAPLDSPIRDTMRKYPGGCTPEERLMVHTVARAALFVRCGFDSSRKWAQYFWRHNFNLAVCRPAALLQNATDQPIAESQSESLGRVLAENASRLSAYLKVLRESAKPDLYDPQRDEIMYGLLTRVVRLYLLICTDLNLWARDTAGIVLRCLAETAITFGYLAKKGTAEDFESFRAYGEGQEKLLMLHLQEIYPNEKSLEGRTGEDLSAQFDGLTSELQEINLGVWNRKDTRILAEHAGMMRFYRLVFTPTSTDIHGTWTSLKQSYLSRCIEVLHRFHRLPGFPESFFVFAEPMVAAQEIVVECLNIAANVLTYSPLAEPLAPILEALRGRGEP